MELNAEQRRAAEAVRGPVCILAGAGTGKTTTITHRIARQVETGAFRAEEILAVTFTDKAAGEMRARLSLPVTVRTFHAAALAQLHRYAPGRVGKIVPSKALPLRRIANSLPRAYRFRPAGDLATEIEWAKNRRVSPDAYLRALGDHEPPIPPDLMRRVYTQYEQRKNAAGYCDFEDVLELAVRTFEEDEAALADVRERFHAFTVDEYQDVNLLQQSLLDLWLGARDDLCVVGDENQSIYSFTGASSEWLLGFDQRFPNATVIRLHDNYRSTAQVLALGNRFATAELRATRADGPEPELRECDDEGAFVVARIGELGLPYEDVAVLARTNARLADFEEALHAAGIPSQGSSFLARESARFVLRRLASPADVRGLAEQHGWVPEPPDKLGERELVRQNDLARLVALADELAHLDGPAFVAELESRFGHASQQGVHLLTLHGAKGLEFEAVFVVHAEEKELPTRLAKTPAEIAEERRLFYVGLTRAKRHLFVTWTRTPSRFLRELGVAAPPKRAEPLPDDPVFAALRKWRLERARSDEVPPYVVFHNTTLAEIAERKPTSLRDLARVPGVGPTKLERYGGDVLGLLESLYAVDVPTRTARTYT